MIAVPSRMISIMIVTPVVLLGVRQDKGRWEAAFHAFWRGDDLFDLSDINMEPKCIKVRDGRQAIYIKIL
ncbi:hypothetical protein EHI47_05825 [Rhizobium leguminosarum]|jgi:hypothetical protein|uniref:Uncharacterized protein n=2 Tax=Rhizobium TaxID=379 RepID=A0A444I992_RHILE|nr:hypothetical protein [Rhizobium leguminosarum bv. viciae]RWX04783.1 hypothetical protein EHI45_31400 [Rhizobium leguminosarum]TBE60982.1 hypothetical protein ELH03_29555 [Rhizobium beringeri]RWX35180.1 hypothetical protein EHI47_05825 [Rhizobium leguminosarum]TAU45134.1 hypothetical protein ELI43_26555 [Rhizobium leguminosarum]